MQTTIKPQREYTAYHLLTVAADNSLRAGAICSNTHATLLATADIISAANITPSNKAHLYNIMRADLLPATIAPITLAQYAARSNAH